MEGAAQGKAGDIFEKYRIVKNEFKYCNLVAQEDRQRYHNEMTLYEHGQYKPDSNKPELSDKRKKKTTKAVSKRDQ